MFWRTARIASLILFCALPTLIADVPATQPQTGATDAFRSFLLDIQQGNSADLANVCSAHDGNARSLLHNFQSIAIAMKYLRTTVAAKFGPNSVAAISPALPTLDDLDDVTERTAGDHAELSGGAVWPMHMIKIQGQWKLDLDWLTQSEYMPANPHWFGEMATAIHRTADDIASGKLATADAAALAMQARQQAIPDSPPATAPTTQH